ncbi:MAG: AAA family ATPase [Deltaproteobacteria bacterium]|nr:AAA family ATPase [Deltaproteobacteria bacterium]
MTRRSSTGMMVFSGLRVEPSGAALLALRGSAAICPRAIIAKRAYAPACRMTSVRHRPCHDDSDKRMSSAIISPAGGMKARLLRDRLRDRWTQAVLILDKAHDLRRDALSMLRVITNFKMDSQLVLSFVLAGQPALRDLLTRDDQEALRPVARGLSFTRQVRRAPPERPIHPTATSRRSLLRRRRRPSPRARRPRRETRGDTRASGWRARQ